MESMLNGWWERKMEPFLRTYWQAIADVKKPKPIRLLVKCDFKLPKVTNPAEFNEKFRRVLYTAFIAALFYEDVKEGETIEFKLDNSGNNPLGFRYERKNNKIEFDFEHPKKSELRYDLSLSNQSGILKLLQKEN